MRLNYSRLGDHISPVDIRNDYLAVTKLLGVSMEKCFIPSVANTHGVDLSTYKIVKKNQFACKLMSVGRDEKLPVDILKDYDEAIVSPAYYVFETPDEAALSPDYLMMWLSRAETDRWVGYVSGGDVRGGISWEQFCELPIVVPHIKKQQEIIREYNAIIRHIKLNERLCQKLEEGLRAVYKQWFIDFEFPITKNYANKIGRPELEGASFKSNSLNMSWNEELEAEIPEGWSYVRLDEISSVSAGGDLPKVFSETVSEECRIPVFSNSTENEGLYGFTGKAKIKEKSITISARGAIIGYAALRLMPFFPIVRLIVVTPKTEYYLNYLFEAVKRFRYDSGASAQGQLTVPDISSFKLLQPDTEVLSKYQEISSRFISLIELKKSQSKTLYELLNVLHARMSRIQP